MKTVITKRIEMATQEIRFGYWDMARHKFIPLYDLNEDESAEAATKLGVSELLLDSLTVFSDTIAELVGRDLANIWERLDRIEKK